MADAIRNAYRPLFDANENADRLSQEELRGLVAQVAGTDKDMTTKILGTFNALKRRADFAQAAESRDESTQLTQVTPEPAGSASSTRTGALPTSVDLAGFHFNIQVHLPANATEEVYVSIFSALRKVFG
jgi:hypothetical protein